MEQGNFLALPAVPFQIKASDDERGQRLVLLDLYDREQASLRRYLAALGVEPETARDVVQEAFLKLHEHLLNGGDRTNLRAWLYRVAHNGARNIQMAYGARKTGRIDESEPAHNPASEDPSAEQLILGQERERKLSMAMDALSDAQRSCLILRAQGMKYREIADSLQLSISTVGENIQRGLQRLKESI